MEWSDAKQKVFRFESDMVVSAGAGSGKTAALVELYLRLLAGETTIPRPLSVEEIVAITFTDKAAVEMKERVRREMRKRLAKGDAAADWERFLRSLPAAFISTFHALCARILKENPVEAGIDPAFTLLDELATGGELQAALEEVIEGELRARSPEISLLLQYFSLSGAGHGKGLREYLLDLHWKRSGSGKDDIAILRMGERWDVATACLFKDKAIELEGLVAEAQRILAGKELTFHQKLKGLPEIYDQARLSLDDGETVFSLSAMQNCVSGNWGKEKPVRDRLAECLAALQAAYWQRRSAPLAAALLRLSARLSDTYSRRKDRRGALDFEDLLIKTRQLLQKDEQLRADYRQRFAVVMVDEFQDTNPLQKELVDLLCGEGQRLFIVGDPKQSIYLFRGADVSVFAQAQAEARESGGQNLYFQESFRSRQGIISFVNRIFCRVMEGGGADFETNYGAGDHLEPQRCDWDETPCVELLTIGGGANSGEKRRTEAAAIARKIRWLVSGQDEVKVYDNKKTGTGDRGPGTGESELEKTGNREPGTGTSNLEPAFLPRKPRFGDIAILFRRFSNLKIFERELRNAGIPYYVVKGKGFYRCQEVLDILNFLKYLDFGGDLVAQVGVFRSPLCGISDETLYLLSRCEGGIGGWEKLVAEASKLKTQSPFWDRIEGSDRDRLRSLHLLVSRLRPLRDRLTLAELLEEILTGSDYASTLLTSFQGEQKVANLRKLIELARSFADRGEGALRRYVNYMKELVDAEPTEAEAVISTEGEDVVRLMTVHQSKGLEFPAVFVPELGAGQPADNARIAYDNSLGLGVKPALPGSDGEATLAFREITALRKSKEAAEAKRLFYVAVTRARDYLILSGEGRGEWRQWVDAFREEEDIHLIRVTEAAALLEEGLTAGGSATAAEEGREEVAPDLIAAAIRRALHYIPPLPSDMVFSPTALEDYRECPRKYFYKAVMGLDEGLFAELLGGGPDRQRKEKKRGMTALDKGNLAHAMLEALDFAATGPVQRAACERIAALASAGQPPEDVAEVIDYVAAFAASPLAHELAGKRLQREHPFTIKFRGAAVYYVKGAMDLVAEDENGVTVYDYKYMEGERGDLEGYRFQLRTYMLALAGAYPGRRIEGELLFLKGGGGEEITCDFAAFERELLEIMDAIRGRGAEEDFRLKEGCDGRHCPFRERCLAAS